MKETQRRKKLESSQMSINLLACLSSLSPVVSLSLFTGFSLSARKQARVSLILGLCVLLQPHPLFFCFFLAKPLRSGFCCYFSMETTDSYQ